MGNELISIIVPVYKVEKYLDRCVQSILAQTYRDIEVILVDDGSPDNCGRICDAYQVQDPRIRVIHKENGGLSDARNAGLRIASGQYLGFVDSDDYIAPDMYEHLYSIMVNNRADISVCSACVVLENEMPEFTDDTDSVALNREDCLEAMIYKRQFSVNTWNKLYRKEVFTGIEFPYGKLYEDLATTYRLIENATVIVVSNAKKYAYVQRPGSIMNQTATAIRTDKIDIIEEMWAHFSNSTTAVAEKIRAGIINYIVNDVFRMIGANRIVDNDQYRIRVKKFISHHWKVVVGNDYLSLRNKVLLCTYLLNPHILKCINTYKIGRRDKA